MKINFSCFLILSGFLLISGCNEDETDYRDKYAGEWAFNVRSLVTNSVGDTTRNDSIYSKGNISKVGGDNKLQIEYENPSFSYSMYLTFIVDSDGNISSTGEKPESSIEGSFENADKINLEYKGWGPGIIIKHFIQGERL